MGNEIKVTDARRIATERDYDMVIVIGIQKDKSGHITTYGKNQEFCNIAGYLGQEVLASLTFEKDGILDNFVYERDIKEDIPKLETRE